MDDLMTTVDVGRLAGVGPTSVKRWADEGLIPCVRTAGGHRRFPRDAVESFLRRQRGSTADATVDLLLRTEGLGVEARLLAERSRLGSWVAVAEHLGMVVGEIGRRWRAGSITIIQEHLATERLSRAVSRISEAMPVAPTAPRCLLACAEGDDHALGLSLVELCLREVGWRTLWSGRRTPTDELVAMAHQRSMEMLALSASAASTEETILGRQLAQLAPACAGAGVALALGGDGAWPDPPPPGRRFRALAPFAEWARALVAAGATGPAPSP